MRKLAFFAAAALLIAAPAFCVTRSSTFPLAGTVKEVQTTWTYTVSLSGGGQFSQTTLDLEIEDVGPGPSGARIFKTVRIDCSAFLVDCRNLRKGDAITAQVGFALLESGIAGKGTLFYLVAPIDWQ